MSTYKEESEEAKNIRRNALPQKEYNVLPLEKKSKTKKHYSVQHKLDPNCKLSGLAQSWCKEWSSYTNYHTLKDAQKALVSYKKGWLSKYCIFRIVKDGVPIEE